MLCNWLNKSYRVHKSCLTDAHWSVCVSLRGLFIIDDKGILRQITMNDLPVGRSVDETLRLVQAFQYTDKHGEGSRSSFKLQNLETNTWFSVDSLRYISCADWNCVFFFPPSVPSRMEARQRHCEYHWGWDWFESLVTNECCFIIDLRLGAMHLQISQSASS